MTPPSVKAQRLKEREPIKGDWQTSLIVASRRSHTPWRDVADLVDLSVTECKARLDEYNAIHAPTPTFPTSTTTHYD